LNSEEKNSVNNCIYLGAEFLARITKIQSEKYISYYHQAKGRKSIQGVNSKFLQILRTADDITEDALDCKICQFHWSDLEGIN
jgi:uncharacterized protein YPO0396